MQCKLMQRWSGVRSAGDTSPRLPNQKSGAKPWEARLQKCLQKPAPVPFPPLAPWAASPHTHFLAELFLGLSLTSAANQAHSDKALKSSAVVSPSEAGPSPAGHGLSTGQRLGCTCLEVGAGQAPECGLWRWTGKGGARKEGRRAGAGSKSAGVVTRRGQRPAGCGHQGLLLTAYMDISGQCKKANTRQVLDLLPK